MRDSAGPGRGKKGGNDDDAVDGWTMLTHAVHPGIATLLMLGEIQRVRSVRVRETGQKLAVVSRRYAMPSMHCSCSTHRAASRRAAPVRPPVGEIATRDRIHIITGERGSCSISHIAHRVIASHGRRLAASRMRLPCILHALCAHSLSLSLHIRVSDGSIRISRNTAIEWLCAAFPFSSKIEETRGWLLLPDAFAHVYIL